MAKIALITDSFSPLVESLATSLSHQKQDVTIITTRSAFEKVPSHLNVLTPFRKWNSIEAVRALPILISQNFDVWHFLFPASESRPRAAHWLLASVARSIPQKIVVGSFAGPGSLKRWDARFLKLLDLALFSSRSFLMQAKRNKWLKPSTLAEVLPPLEGLAVPSEGHVREETHRLLKGLRPFLILPELQEGPDWIENSPLDFVVLKPHPKKGSNHKHVFYTGYLTPAERDLLISRAKAICLLYGDYSALELQRFHQWSETAACPLIVRQFQTDIWPGLCWNLKSGWILEDIGDPLQNLLIENPALVLASGYQNYSRRELVDSTLNHLLRLYQKSFVLRWSGE